MNLNLIIPSPPAEVNFSGSGCSTPFTSAPSSPPPQQSARFLHFSAPASPTAAELTHNPSLKDADFTFLSASSVPFQWEASPGVAKARAEAGEDERGEFEFDFSGRMARNSLCADELFDGGRIRPLKPPPGLQVGTESETGLSNSLRFRTTHSSPRGWRKQHAVADPFTKALEEARRSRVGESNPNPSHVAQSRGRDQSLKCAHKKTRSLSPYRVADILSDDSLPASATKQPSGASPSFWDSFSIPKAYRKWRIKDLLFRSASEGRATEQLAVTESPHSSFRSTETMTSAAGSISRRRSSRVPVSAHELHYKVNRAVSQELRKKTFLPYKQGLLGCLGFIPSSGSEIGRSSISSGSMPRV
uniref:Calmodulin-binding protein n=1 Tax=Kalanchoe fedtschenkoi TaxID=63787 RepID=A0A7N0T0W7_KALFE